MFVRKSEKVTQIYEILLKLEESQENSGIFIIHINDFFAAQ